MGEKKCMRWAKQLNDEAISNQCIYRRALQTTNERTIDVLHFIGQAQDFKRQCHDMRAGRTYVQNQRMPLSSEPGKRSRDIAISVCWHFC